MGIDAEQRLRRVGDLVAAAIARRDEGKEDHVRRKAEPENDLPHGVPPEDRRGHGSDDDAHIGDEIGRENVAQREIHHVPPGEPRHQQEMPGHRAEPHRFRREGKGGMDIGAELHDRHEKCGEDTGEDGIAVQIIFHHLRMENDLQEQERSQKDRAETAGIFQQQRPRGEQVAERRQAEHDAGCAGCGNGYISNHDSLPL